ncbi:MAG: hypothetical protein P4L96_00020, partial [Rhodoferax sp.]|nr:hypothetical protein [Rhodoferax sp.]
PLLVQDVKLKPLRLGGMVKLSAATFTPQHPSQLSVRVENLISALIPAIGTLGSTEIHLTTQANQTAQWTANPIDGALAIHGEGTFNPTQGTTTGKLAFKPDERLAGNLRPILALLQKGAGGEYLLNLPAS